MNMPQLWNTTTTIPMMMASRLTIVGTRLTIAETTKTMGGTLMVIIIKEPPRVHASSVTR